MAIFSTRIENERDIDRQCFVFIIEYNSRNIIIPKTPSLENFHFASDFKIFLNSQIKFIYSIVQVVEIFDFFFKFSLQWSVKIRKGFYYTYTESRIHLFWQMLSRTKLGQVILHDGRRINRGNLSRDRCSALISRLKQLARERWIIKEQT